MYWGLAGTVGTQGPEDIYRTSGGTGEFLGGEGGCFKVSWGVGGGRGVLGLEGTLGTQGQKGIGAS